MGNVFAVSFNGTAGSISTGSNLIQAAVPKLIKTTIHVDFDFGMYAGTGNLRSDQNINIAMNYASTYQIVATGDGVANAFTITNGSDSVGYSVFFNDETGMAGQIQLVSGSALTGQTGGVTPLSNTVPNANISVLILESDLKSAEAGVFEGHVVFTLTPE